jgi:hypothetical protein
MTTKSVMNAGLEVLSAVVMKTAVFWDITPCSPLKVNRRFGGTYLLHLQGPRISRARYQRESRKRCVPPKRRLNFSGLYGVIFQKTVLFICYGCWENCLKTTSKSDWIQCGKCTKWLYESCTTHGLFCNSCGRDEKRKNNEKKRQKQ